MGKNGEDTGKPCLPVLSNYIGGSISIVILRLLCVYEGKGDE